MVFLFFLLLRKFCDIPLDIVSKVFLLVSRDGEFRTRWRNVSTQERVPDG